MILPSLCHRPGSYTQPQLYKFDHLWLSIINHNQPQVYFRKAWLIKGLLSFMILAWTIKGLVPNERPILIQRLSNKKRLAGSNVKGGPTAGSGRNGPLVHPWRLIPAWAIFACAVNEDLFFPSPGRGNVCGRKRISVFQFSEVKPDHS